MTDQRTIFLATDGRYVTIGRHDVVMPAHIEADINRQGLAGWMVFVSGNIHVRRKPELVRVGRGYCNATDAQWDAAVAAFHANRRAPATRATIPIVEAHSAP